MELVRNEMCPKCLKNVKDMIISKMKFSPRRCEKKYPNLKTIRDNEFYKYIYIEICCDSCDTEFIIENAILKNQ